MKTQRWIFTVALSFVLFVGATNFLAGQSRQKPGDLDHRTQLALVDEVRHQLLMLPYYGIFDWLQAKIETDGTVILQGQVVRPTTKSDAEARVKKIEGVNAVKNQIETLPASTFDQETRVAIYRRLVHEVGLEKYFLQAVPPIHIIVQGGHVTLKGMVASSMDSQLAYMAAAGVPNVFDVKNELVVDKN